MLNTGVWVYTKVLYRRSENMITLSIVIIKFFIILVELIEKKIIEKRINFYFNKNIN
jgi:hypothetical protein